MNTTATEVKERPILFSAPMVRAILEGRKTQTRRVVKHGFHGATMNRKVVKASVTDNGGMVHFKIDDGKPRESFCGVKCPYGEIGSRLWVRETWSGVKQLGGTWVREKIHYRASEGDNELIKWKPSIHMPRVASRILLEITNIRVERLLDISDRDAIDEGIEEVPSDMPLTYRNYLPGYEWDGFAMPKDSFETLWQSINGTDSWEANPWVWVVEFKQVERSKP